MAPNSNVKIDYQGYLAEYNAKKAALNAKGYQMRDPVPYSELEYKTVYKALVNDRHAEVKSGERKSIGNIRRELINTQAWSSSNLQANALYKYAKLTGQKVKLLDIRAKGTEAVDFTEYKKKYNQLMKDRLVGGLTKSEIKVIRREVLKELGQTMFGSK